MGVKFIVRKDEPPLYFGKFQTIDIVIGILSLLPVLPIALLTPIPFPLALVMCTGGVFFYILRFRVGKPPGYFGHWLRFKMRPKFWRYSARHCDTLLGARMKWLLCARPLENHDGEKSIWLGPGFPRYKKPANPDNAWLQAVERDLRDIEERLR